MVVAGAVRCGNGVVPGAAGLPPPGPGGFPPAAGGGVGARAWGGSSPTIALGWMLRSWFLFPVPSSCRVRICHGAPDTRDAPSRAPPAAVSQYLDWARWPPQARRTAGPVETNVTTKSAVL